MTAVHKFLAPFASAGDKAPLPAAIQTDGSVSYPEGWGFDYSRNPSADPLAKRIDRATFNQLMYDITSALGQHQTQGAPEWITATENGGAPYPYAARAIVRYGNAVYQSLVENNIVTPGTDATKWAAFDAVPVATTANDPTFADSSAKAASTGWVRGAMGAIATAAGFYIVLETNGCVKFPTWLGGLVIQWGTVMLTPTAAAYNFRMTFPASCLVAGVFPGSVNNIPTITSTTTTQFTAAVSSGTTVCTYIAIGR